MFHFTIILYFFFLLTDRVEVRRLFGPDAEGPRVEVMLFGEGGGGSGIEARRRRRRRRLKAIR